MKRKLTYLKRVAVTAVCACVAFFAWAAPVSTAMADSSEVRSQVKDLYFTAPLPSVRNIGPKVVTTSAGDVFQVRVEETDDSVQIIVAPQKAEKVESYTSSGVVVSWVYSYPVGVPGSWVLFRNKTTGKSECIRYYFTGESSMYVQFRPASDGATGKSLVDLVIGGMYRSRNIVVGLPIERFYTASFSDIKKATEHSIPWYTFAPYSEMYDGIRQMVAVIRENLPRFRFMDNIVQDEYGYAAYVGIREADKAILSLPASDEENRIFTSSCGFVKWIADGMTRPLSGTGLLIDPLLYSTVEHRPGSLAAAWADQYNTSLSLNWTRNIASAIVSVFTGRDYSFENAGVLVDVEPFTAIYSAATGYTVSSLNALMYHLALTEPDRFYLGAIRHTYQGETEVSVYNEAVAFFPWIDEKQRFCCAVFMNGAELTMEEFMSAYSGDFVQLVRLTATEQFFPR